MLVTAMAKTVEPGYQGGRARLRWVAAIGEDGVGSGAGMFVGGGGHARHGVAGWRRGMASCRWYRAPGIGEDCACEGRICSGSCANLGRQPWAPPTKMHRRLEAGKVDVDAGWEA